MNALDKLAINTVRALILDTIEFVGNGHMGGAVGAAPIGYELFRHHLRHNPANPLWFNRDRFILSVGHESMLLYSLLHLSGYNLTMEDLKAFRQLRSQTPGHPEVNQALGIEATTGPLGQGIGMAVGMALAEAHLAERFNKPGYPVVDHYTYALCGDGDLIEGVAVESAAVAGTMGLGKLIVLYDSNKVTSDGPLTLSTDDEIHQKFQAMNWQTLLVEDGNDATAIRTAITAAKAETTKPTLIEVKTIIGYGSTYQGQSRMHNNPVGPEEAAKMKAVWGWDKPPFFIPQQVRDDFGQMQVEGCEAERAWQQVWNAYQAAFSQEGALLDRAVKGDFPWTSDLMQKFKEDALATRSASGQLLNRLYQAFPFFLGGGADLSVSTKATIADQGYMDTGQHQVANIPFGVREFAMGAICNGIALHGGLHAQCGTFLVFSDYMRAAIRLSALMSVPVTYLFSHDSLRIGQDGPTHQPIEHLMALRTIPNLIVFRPADANETIAAWQVAMEAKGPVALALSKQPLPVLAEVDLKGAARGGYILSKDADEPDLILIATGSEVAMALEAKAALRPYQVNVVSLPSWELFEQQDRAYRDQILPPSVDNRISIELGRTLGWSRYVGNRGIAIGVDSFGDSALGQIILEDRGFTVERIVREAMALLVDDN